MFKHDGHLLHDVFPCKHLVGRDLDITTQEPNWLFSNTLQSKVICDMATGRLNINTLALIDSRFHAGPLQPFFSVLFTTGGAIGDKASVISILQEIVVSVDSPEM